MILEGITAAWQQDIAKLLNSIVIVIVIVVVVVIVIVIVTVIILFSLITSFFYVQKSYTH